MNKIILKGMIRNIEHSHNVKEIEYQKAELIVPRTDGEDDVLDLKFKRYANQYTEGQIVWLQGNVRSYSQKLDTGKNKVELYVFTYFDIPDVGKDDQELINQFQLDGKVCKVDKLRKNKDGKDSFHFILANNIYTKDKRTRIDTYVPCVCFGELARKLSQTLKVSDSISLTGQLHSRTYKKYHENGEMEIKTAHEAVVMSYESIN